MKPREIVYHPQLNETPVLFTQLSETPKLFTIPQLN